MRTDAEAGGGLSAAVRRILWPKGSRDDVWALVDAARDRRLYWSLVNSYLPFSCLFAGQLPEVVERVAPYVIELRADDSFTELMLSGWGRSFGVYLECDRSLAELRHHLRTFLTVTDAAGDKMLFRYYDPRVLRAYLPTCDEAELRAVFGPIRAFWMEARDSGVLLEYRFDRRGLRVVEHDVRGVG